MKNGMLILMEDRKKGERMKGGVNHFATRKIKNYINNTTLFQEIHGW